jgi:DNA-binding CsgD family transcriptional regulator
MSLQKNGELSVVNILLTTRRGAVRGLPTDSPHEHLSPAELGVFRALLAGHNQTETARLLGKSIKTIATQKKAIFLRLGASTVAELVTYAYQHGVDRVGP